MTATRSLPTATQKSVAPTAEIAIETGATVAPMPSLTRQPTRTATFTALPEPKLDCVPVSDGFNSCRDSILGIDFEYPETWGAIEPILRHGETGRSYDYQFSNASPHVQAGGRSRDWSLGRGGTWTDFQGFSEERTLESYCDFVQAAVCESVKPDVYRIVRLPTADMICYPAPGSFFQPASEVVVDLPANALINGFVFIAPFTSASLQSSLDSLLAFVDPIASNCDDASRASYDAAIDQLAKDIRSSNLDRETLQNMSALQRLAESITIQ
jgi:hypothetical protein